MFKFVVGTLLLAAVFAEDIAALTSTLPPQSGDERSVGFEGGVPDDRYVPVPSPTDGNGIYPFASMARRIERIEDLLERMYATMRVQCGVNPQQQGFGYPPPPFGSRGNGNELPQPGKANPTYPENGQYNPQYQQPYGAWNKRGQTFPTRAKRSEVMNAETPIIDEEIKPDLHIVEEPKEEFTTTLLPEIDHDLPATEFTTALPIEQTTFEELTTSFPAETFQPELHADEQLTSTTLFPDAFTFEFTTTLPADHFNAAEPTGIAEDTVNQADPELGTRKIEKPLSEITEAPIAIESTTAIAQDSSSEEEEEEKKSRKKRQLASSESDESIEIADVPIAETTLAPIAPEAIEHSISPIKTPAAVNLVAPVADSAAPMPDATAPVNTELEKSSEDIEITTAAPIEEKPLIVPAAAPVVETPMEMATPIETPMETPTAPETPIMTPEATMETAPTAHETAPATPAETPIAAAQPTADEATWTTEFPTSTEWTSTMEMITGEVLHAEPAAAAQPTADEATWTTEFPISTEWTTTMEMVTKEILHVEPAAPETVARRKRGEEAVVADEMLIETTVASTTFLPKEVPAAAPEASVVTNDAASAPTVEAAPMPVETPTAVETPLITEEATTFPVTTEHAPEFAETVAPEFAESTMAPELFETTTLIPEFSETTLAPEFFETTTLAPEFAESTLAPEFFETTLAPEFSETVAPEFAETTLAPEFAESTFAPTEAAPIETAPVASAAETPMTNDVPEVALLETTFAPTIEPELTTITEAFHRKKRSEETIITEAAPIATEAAPIADPVPAPTATEEERKFAPFVEVDPTEATKIFEETTTLANDVPLTEKMEITEEEHLSTTPLPLIPEETEIADLPADDEPHKPAAPIEVTSEMPEIATDKEATPAIKADPPKPVVEDSLAWTTALPLAKESSEEDSSEEKLDAAMEVEAANPVRRRFARFAH